MMRVAYAIITIEREMGRLKALGLSTMQCSRCHNWTLIDTRGDTVCDLCIEDKKLDRLYLNEGVSE